MITPEVQLDSTLNSRSIDILIVDDIIDNLRLLAAILEAEGYRVRKALTGKLALLSVGAAPPDLILLDIQLPDIPGYKVCQQIRSNPQTAHIPIVFLSASSQSDVQEQVTQAGGTGYVTKPLNIEEVLNCIQHHLNLAPHPSLN